MVSMIDRLSKTSTKLGDVKTGSGNDYRVTDDLDFLDLSDKEWHRVRILPGMFSMGQHWPEFVTKAGNVTAIPRPAHNWDPKRHTADSTKPDPLHKVKDKFTSKGKVGTGFGVAYYIQVINRDMQEDLPTKLRVLPEETETGFKRKGSKSQTPVQCIRLSRSDIEELQKLSARNKPRGSKQAVDIDDVENGRDIIFMYDKDSKKPGSKMSVAFADDSVPGPLTRREREYLVFDILGAVKKELAKTTVEETEAWIKEQLASRKGGGSDDDDDADDDIDLDEDDLDDDDEPKRKKKKVVGKKKRRPVQDDDEDEDDDDDLGLDDDDDEPAPVRKKKRVVEEAPVRKKKRRVVEEEPVRKKKSSSSSSGTVKKKKRPLTERDMPF